MPSNSGKSRSDGEGSLYQRHDRGCPALVDGERPEHKCLGPWVGALVVGYLPAEPGKRPKAIRKKVVAPTRAAAAARLRELHEKHSSDELPQGKPITVEKWMKHWLGQIAPRKVKDSSLETYSTNVEQYIVPLLGRHRLDRLTAEHIDDAWDQLLDIGNPLKPAPANPEEPRRHERQPLSANTVHLAHRTLARALRVAVQKKRIKTNPAGPDSMDAPPRIDAEVEAIPVADIEAILATAAGTPYGARWSVALSLGLRPGEALGLRWEDVDLKTGSLSVRQQLQRRKGRGLVTSSPKSESGKRSMYLPENLTAALKAHRRAQNEAKLLAGDHWTDAGLIFTLDNGKGIDGKTDRLRWHKLLDTAGVTQRRLYDARHSAATLLLAQGVPLRVAMELLGHSQVSVTMKYQHALDEMKADAAKRIQLGMWGEAQ